MIEEWGCFVDVSVADGVGLRDELRIPPLSPSVPMTNGAAAAKS